MNAFDRGILEWAAQASGTSPQLDLIITFITANHLFKGFVVMGAIWWLWFRDPVRVPGAPDAPSVRAQVMVTLLAGLIALLMIYTLVVLLAPRVYLGMHYPTDILVGAAIGVAIAWAVHVTAVRQFVAGPFLRWQAHSPGTFYACAFLLTSQIAVLFDPVRHVARFASDLMLAAV